MREVPFGDSRHGRNVRAASPWGKRPILWASMPPFSGMRCLVVDDEPRLRRVLVRLLEGEGFACAEAGSGAEALQELEKGAVPLVISDLRMPEMDGVTLLREIITRWPDTAVIVVTAVAEVESAVACLQMGATMTAVSGHRVMNSRRSVT